MKDNFSHSASVFTVVNMEESINFYTKLLQFNLTFSWGNPTDYAVLKKGGVSIHLASQPEKHIKEKIPSHIYIFVYDVDAMYNLCKNNGINITSPPAIRDYGMKDFDIVDIDGNLITFGKGQ